MKRPIAVVALLVGIGAAAVIHSASAAARSLRSDGWSAAPIPTFSVATARTSRNVGPSPLRVLTSDFAGQWERALAVAAAPQGGVYVAGTIGEEKYGHARVFL